MLPRLLVEGRVVADPQLRFATSGNAVVSLRVVASDRRRTDSGEWEESDTLWLDVTVFGKLAENVAESVVKGDLVLIGGKLRSAEWDDRETGQKRSKVEMIADSIGASLQFRILPRGGEMHAERARARAANPVQQAYGPGDPGSVVPPF